MRVKTSVEPAASPLVTASFTLNRSTIKLGLARPRLDAISRRQRLVVELAASSVPAAMVVKLGGGQ
jgi:hypothetical protein